MWDIALDHNGENGLARQIYLALKERILAGKLEAGEALPSTREFSLSLGVSRNTVNTAYDMLWTEGFIVNRQGAPSRVAEGLRLSANTPVKPEREAAAGKRSVKLDLKTGQPDLAAFPWKQWNEELRRAAESLTAIRFAYSGPKGYEPLCGEIARWLLRARNMEVDPGDVFITSGSTQALHLLVDILRQNGRAFAIESPSHPGIRTVIGDKGLPICYMPVDGRGADVSTLEKEALAAVYVTPSHQFPLGGILPANRRAALLRLAADKDFYIIEDDYDSEFRYTGAPVSPIYAMDSSRVAYVGTFSKTLFPALRIGFAVLPKALQGRWRHARNYMDVQNPVLEQAALAGFLQKRKMDRHIRRMKKLYAEKRNALLAAVRTAFGDAANPRGDASGLHIALQFPGYTFGEEFLRRCEETGIRIMPVSKYCEKESEYRDTLLLGYGHLRLQQMEAGVNLLRAVITGSGNLL